MLTDDELAGMRATVNESFGDSVTLQRAQAGSDTEGNPTMSLSTVATFIGWLQAPQIVGADPGTEAGQAGQKLDGVLLAPTGIDIRPGDRALVRGTWRVATVADVLIHQRCELTKVDR